MPMLQAKLTLPFNATKCLSAPSYALADPTRYGLTESDVYYLKASQPNSRRPRNPYNVLLPPLTEELLRKHRRDINAAKTPSKIPFSAPDVDLSKVRDRITAVDPIGDDDDFERGCCLQRASKVNDKFDAQCDEESGCGRWFHPSCLSTKFRVQKKRIRALPHVKPWLCPLCSRHQADDQSESECEAEMESASDNVLSTNLNVSNATNRRKRKRVSVVGDCDGSESSTTTTSTLRRSKRRRTNKAQ